MANETLNEVVRKFPTITFWRPEMYIYEGRIPLDPLNRILSDFFYQG